MKKITARDVIRNVPERWKQQYFYQGKWSSIMTGDAGIVYERLCALNLETAVSAQIAEIIGNESWSRLLCDECNQYVDAVVQIGQEEGLCARLCHECLSKAVDTMVGVLRMTGSFSQTVTGDSNV